MRIIGIGKDENIDGRGINDNFPENYSDVAVILIDMQPGFVSRLRRGEADRIVPSQVAVLKFCKEKNIPIVILEFFGSGSTVQTLADEIGSYDKVKIIEKNYNDGFRNTVLNAHLKLIGAKKLFLMGINADFCVRETAEGAIERGYKIITSDKVIAGMPHHSQNNSLPWYRKNGVCVDNVFSFVAAA